MIKRWFPRAVLVAIMVGLAWLALWTWSVGSLYMPSRVLFFIIESSVFVAALSLLIETFLHSESITVSRRGLTYILGGFSMIIEEKTEKALSSGAVSVRMCPLFAARSFILAMLSVLVAVFFAFLYSAGEALILFLMSPYVPVIDWSSVLKWAAFFVAMIITVPVLIKSFGLLENKMSAVNNVVRAVVLGLYVAVLSGLFLGISFYALGPVGPEPLYLFLLAAIGVCVGIFVFVGLFLFIAFSVFWAARNFIAFLSSRFPSLNEVWNQVCPPRTVVIE